MLIFHRINKLNGLSVLIKIRHLETNPCRIKVPLSFPQTFLSCEILFIDTPYIFYRLPILRMSMITYTTNTTPTGIDPYIISGEVYLDKRIRKCLVSCCQQVCTLFVIIIIITFEWFSRCSLPDAAHKVDANKNADIIYQQNFRLNKLWMSKKIIATNREGIFLSQKTI